MVQRYLFKATIFDGGFPNEETYYTEYGYIDGKSYDEIGEKLHKQYGLDLVEISLKPLEEGYVFLIPEELYNEIKDGSETYG